MLTAAPAATRAADITDVATAFDEDNPFDLRVRLRYDHTEKAAQLKREFELAGQDRINIYRDLLYAFHRDVLTPRIEAGLFHDLMIHAELPIIIAQNQDYSFDDGVGITNSSTVRDGIVPAGGVDAPQNGVSVGAPFLFRGVNRGAAGGKGLDALDTINFGLTWAPVNQKRDDTKPTWILTFEPQISIGNVMAFDRARPKDNHAVSEGVHRLLARTVISHRFRWIDPYLGFWYIYPVARGDSLFQQYSPSQKVSNPMQQGGSVFGFEAVPFERPRSEYKFAIDFRGRIEGHFQGRGYSEAWELLAAAPPLACVNLPGANPNPAAYNPACDPAQVKNAYQGQPFTGITTIASYATLGADIALSAQLGPYFKIRTSFEYSHDQAHLITGDDIGVPTTASGRVMSAPEYNPAYRAVIDQVGRRYLADNVNIYNFYIWAQLQF
jgi:hypothetical protein